MKKLVGLMTLALCVAMVGTAFAAGGHYKVGGDWTLGAGGTYVIVQDGTNRVLVGAAIDGVDPKHAWVNKDFGANYTIRCDVNVLTWADKADPSRAGIVGRLQPVGVSKDNPKNDVGVCLLVHNSTTEVQFLNDLQGWGPVVAFKWLPRTWYTMEMTFNGDNVSGKITNKSKATDTMDIPSWAIKTPENRKTGFVGITASTAAGQTVQYDNFEVIVDGKVVFSDGFEGTTEVPNAVGLTNDWVAGNAGYYVVSGGQLFAIATNGSDPKHVWYKKELIGGGSISADVTMLSWDTNPTHDWSRAGVALHIKPAGTADPTRDLGVCLLFHQELGQVQFLNDQRAWGDANTFKWAVGTKYAFVESSDGKIVKGSIGGTALKDWTFPDPQNRANGFAGLTASTQPGQIAVFDNVVVTTDLAGATSFKDDFAKFFSGTDNWELFQ